ncbi:FtsX-like permease family protein [Paenibacillus spongiae]|uniref:FtsX-like permease family protein n=1 Tax=Paenibacillus spongiae TaxID=2909671 RepID=A0ABY5S8J1_9BACL|nr:FtsX-like permease family protein [Paenibacillus spongiae]UVI30034.1 FtsX-like permease family protein [Paenibacillus spongiae]
MTLFDIAKKNIRGNVKNYFVYFISMLFSVVIYFTFVSLQYSPDVQKNMESQSMQSVFMSASVILFLFVAVFVLYSNNFFMRKRKKEVGLYALLGLKRSTIGKMLFYENLILGAFVLVSGIAIGTLLSKLFNMILLKLLGMPADAGMTFSVDAVINTVIVFAALNLFTSIQGYRIIYANKLIELFRAEQAGEQQPKAFVIPSILAVVCLAVGYWFAFRSFNNTTEILTNISIMLGGIILGTLLLFSSLAVLFLKVVKRSKKYYYNRMNLVTVSNLVYRINGNARTLSVISLLSAVALCALSVGFGTYYGFEKTAKLTAPFSYMFIKQDKDFNQRVDSIIRADEDHPVISQITISVIKSKGKDSSRDLLSEKELKADENPVKVISIQQYNQVARALEFPPLDPVDEGKAIAIRPMYTDYELSDYEGESITLRLPDGDMTLPFAGMTVERVLNWSYPDVMIVVNDRTYQSIETQIPPTDYIGYSVQQQKTTKATADALAAVKTPESKLSSFYSVYRFSLEESAVNVFVLGFLALVFVMATGSIIYFKQLTEASADKSRYDILKKIGVSNQDIGKSLLKQNAFIFLLPLTVGLAHFFAILNLLKKLMSSMAGVNLTLPIVYCVIAFVLIYAAYYTITVNSISKSVIEQSAPMLRAAAVSVIAVCMIALIGISVWSAATAPQEEAASFEKVQLELPKPTGTYAVGTVELHLTDSERVDPWMKDRARELMISVWYPAQQEGEKRALYMEPGAAEHYDRNILPTIGLDAGRIEWSKARTNAWLGAPVAINEEGWPVILYSPGGSIPRIFGTVLVEELASKGYIVVTVDHTYETSVVEFPNGHLVTEQLPGGNRAQIILKMLDVRVDDMRFVLDQLAAIREGGNSDHKQIPLPSGLDKVMNLSKIGIFGHSAGGATAAQLMYVDDRVAAGIDMDGTMGFMPDYPLPVAQHGLDRPFLLMEAGYNSDGEVDSHLTAEDRNSFWRHSSGWKLDLSIPEGAHFTFTDYQFLLPQLESKLSMSPQVIQSLIGFAGPDRMLAAQRSYITAFFDLHLKGIPQSLLLEPSTLYPEVEFVK